MPSLSIITPSFNQGRFIERTIRSVLDQGYPGLEYVVIDGASRDATLDALRRYADRLRWISEPDRGQADAVNKGIRLTSGEIIGWLNSDDVYRPGALHAVADFFERHPAVDVVYGDGVFIDQDDCVLGPYPTEPFDLARLREACYLCQPAVFLRRRVTDRFGLLDERLHFCLDYEYWLRLAHGGAQFAHLAHVLAGARLHPDTKTVRSRMAQHIEINGMFRERFGSVPERWLYNYAHARLERSPIDSRQHLRFACALTALSLWASLRWNHAVPPSVRQTVLIWLKDGFKRWGWSLRAQLGTRLR